MPALADGAASMMTILVEEPKFCVTDFGGFEPAAGLGWAVEGDRSPQGGNAARFRARNPAAQGDAPNPIFRKNRPQPTKRPRRKLAGALFRGGRCPSAPPLFFESQGVQLVPPALIARPLASTS